MKKTLKYYMIIPAIALSGAGLWYAARSFSGAAVNPEPLSIGMEATAVNSLIYIADEKLFFRENGLEVTIDDSFPSGAAAAEAMLKGESDIATPAEFAVVRQVLSGSRLTVLASIDRFMHMKLLARKDRGIRSAADLAGKRIGVPFGTAGDFILGRFLDLSGIDREDLTLVDTQASLAAESLSNGDVDAVVTWQPFVSRLEDLMGAGVVTLPVQSGKPVFCLAVTTGDWLEKHPETSRRFLRALKAAQDFLVQYGEQARAIVRKRLGYDDAYMARIWPEHQFTLRLDDSLILTMEDQARWAIRNEILGAGAVPDFLDYIREESLAEAAPEAVNILR